MTTVTTANLIPRLGITAPILQVITPTSPSAIPAGRRCRPADAGTEAAERADGERSGRTSTRMATLDRRLVADCGWLRREPGAGPSHNDGTADPGRPIRIWFYRDWQPSESLNLANIDVNGSYFGSVANGSAFYRDVPPGHYHVAPVSYNRDFNQDRNVDLAPGQQAYIKILSSQSWDGACRDCMRDTFYAWLISLKTAQVEIACDRNGI
jgi:Protein of unknown function (DUF2846)